MKKNILEICLSPDLGGLELFMLNCFEYFSTKTKTYIVVAPEKKLDSYLGKNKSLLLKRNKFFPIIPALELAKFIDEKEIDFIHFHWTKDMATVVLAKILSNKKPKIMQTRNMSMTRFKDDFYHRWIYSKIELIHAVTYQVEEQIVKFIPSSVRPKTKVVYMGTKEAKIDKQISANLKEKYHLEDSFVIGIVGRIEDAKGQYIVIDALSILKDLEIKLLIVGHTMDEKYLSNLKQKVKDLGLYERVIFTGFTKDVNEHMYLCDSIVLATQKETFGLVVIEAMANKCCMIAVNSGGPLEIIDNNINGLFFDRSAKDLATKIEMIYDNKELKESLCYAGYQKCKDVFDSQKQTQKLYEIITQA